MPARPPEPWSLDSWKRRPLAQWVPYPESAAVARAVEKLASLPPLVTSGEVERLRGLVASAQRGERFLLQAGDCAETVADCRPGPIAGKLKVILQMALVIGRDAGRPVVKVGRLAGQYAKPRSSATETRGAGDAALTLPSYQGDLVNRAPFTAESRRPDAANMVEGYVHAGMTLNFIRALLDAGFADARHAGWWDTGLAGRAAPSLAAPPFLAPPLPDPPFLNPPRAAWEREDEGDGAAAGPGEEFFTSHEGLNLLYESAQTRRVPRREGWYDLTAHLPWIGDRTRRVDGAHAEFFRGVRNPLGVKLGPRGAEDGGDELLRLIDTLNPDNEPGRLVLIPRFGASRVGGLLRRLAERVRREGRTVLWVSDPMHGNTTLAGGEAGGVKTRRFEDIIAELEGAAAALAGLGGLGGVHVELTGEDVTECIGGAGGLTAADLPRNYATACDPRLNPQQSLELAFRLGEVLRAAAHEGAAR